jgi:hypothetical protein
MVDYLTGSLPGTPFHGEEPTWHTRVSLLTHLEEEEAGLFYLSLVEGPSGGINFTALPLAIHEGQGTALCSRTPLAHKKMVLAKGMGRGTKSVCQSLWCVLSSIL